MFIWWRPFCYHLLEPSSQFSHLAPREAWLPGGRQDTPSKLTSLSSVVSTTEKQDDEEMTASNLDIEVSGTQLLGVNCCSKKNQKWRIFAIFMDSITVVLHSSCK